VSAQQRRRQHFFPLQHLRHFADTEGRLWLHDKERLGSPRLVGIRDAGVESWLYAPGEGNPDPQDDYVERMLAQHVDGPAAGPISKFIAGESLTDDERFRLSVYLIYFEMRNPRFRDVFLELMQGKMDGFISDLFSDRERFTRDARTAGVAVSDAGYEAVSKMKVKLTAGAWLNFIQTHAMMGIARIYEMRWIRARVLNDSRFLTGDVGTVKFADGFAVPAGHALGFSNERTHWFVPLSPKAALALAPRDSVDQPPITADWIAAVNRQMAADARRFIYVSDDRPLEEHARHR
jgi:Protein of unknown function (DUF4238)